MKFTKNVKFWLQANSMLGMLASAYLIKVHTFVILAYIGLVLNGLYFIEWTFTEPEDDENSK